MDTKNYIGLDSAFSTFFSKMGKLMEAMSGVTVESNSLKFASGVSVSFQRTLRIPDDGKQYSLPPGLGNFPIYNVKDYASKLPKEWVEKGGVFIPMYQREAMWIQFEDYHDHSHAIKVGLGKVNAITGKSWNDGLTGGSSGAQNYLVLPSQPWLDGINAGDGYVRQFVAMGLGEGYTVESQMTGKEEGGLQVEVYPSKYKPQRWTAVEWFVQQKGGSISIYRKWVEDYPKADSRDFATVTPRMLGLKAGDVLTAMSNDELPNSTMLTLADYNIQKEATVHMVLRLRGGGDDTSRMGLALGGKIVQKLYKDTHGIDYWNQDKKVRTTCWIHILNSDHFKKVTGKDPPTTPISTSTYSSNGYPWYSIYDESKQAIAPNADLGALKSVSTLDGEKGKAEEAQKGKEGVQIPKEQIKEVEK